MYKRKKTIFYIIIKIFNDTIESNEFVSILLVFEIYLYINQDFLFLSKIIQYIEIVRKTIKMLKNSYKNRNQLYNQYLEWILFVQNVPFITKKRNYSMTKKKKRY